MKIRFISAVSFSTLILLFVISVRAQSPISRVAGQTLVCGNNDGAFFLDPIANRLWQAELDEKEGLEYKLEKVEKQKCESCYKLKGHLQLDDQNVKFKAETLRGKSNTLTMNVDLDVPGSKKTKSLKLPCTL